MITATKPKASANHHQKKTRSRSRGNAALKTYRERALELFPGGSNGEYGIPPENVQVLERGKGCRVWDTEGRQYLDMTMVWGSALVGHAHPITRAALSTFRSAKSKFLSIQ